VDDDYLANPRLWVASSTILHMRGRAIEPIVIVSAVARIWLAIVVSNSGYGQPAPAAAEVLQKVKGTYSNLSQYRWSATITEEQVAASGESSVTTASVLVAVQKPNQIRWQVSGSGAATYTGVYVGDEVIISDGNNVVWYRPKLKEYTRTPIGPLATPMGTVSAFIDHIENTFFQGFKVLGTFQARLLREETVSGSGVPVPCYVVEIVTPLQTAFTWWVDEKRNVVLREVFESRRPGQPPSLTRRTEFSVDQIGGSIDKQSFVFSPPSGARQKGAFTQ
jgi:outer membrane lipoprotein-sorting protein